MIKRRDLLWTLTALAMGAWILGTANDAAAAGKSVEKEWPNVTWDDVLAEAKGQQVNWYLWGGSAKINSYVSDWIAKQVEERFGVHLNRVGINDTVEAVNKVLGEAEAGRKSGGSVDMIWINGENFRTLKQADLLFCGYLEMLPNRKYINWEDPTVIYDFGMPIAGCEIPWGRAQVIFVYNPDRVKNPPQTKAELVQWVKDNPGRFTYPAPPDFTGTFFIKHLLYHVAGTYEPFLKEFDQKVFDEVAPKLWAVLNEMKPHLWRGGTTYPKDRPALHQLFANGEVDFTIETHPDTVGRAIEEGRFPPSTQSYVLKDGTISGVHYVAIPSNAANKAGAMVVGNFLISPEAQLEKSKPDVWGVRTALDPARLPENWQQAFNALPRHKAVVSDEALAANSLPEIHATWIPPLEKGWSENVAR